MNSERGSVMVEYAIVALALCAVLLVPLPGTQQSVLELLLQALTLFQSNSLELLSMP